MKESYSYNGFTYIKDYNSNDETIVIQHDKQKPEYLFKFYSLSNYNIESLTQGYLYASHPYDLNDHLDSSSFLLCTSKPLAFNYYEQFFGSFYLNEPEKLKDLYNLDVKRDNLCTEYISRYWHVSSNILGIISLTAKENNILMWPHYTNEQGFQLKFDTHKLEQSIRSKSVNGEFCGLHPVNYVEKLSPIDISQYQQMFIPIFYCFNVKHYAWEYENEWRITISKPQMGIPYSKVGLNNLKDTSAKKENRFVYYDLEAIEEITLGKNFFTKTFFDINWVNEKVIEITCKNEDNGTHLEFLNFISDKLHNKLFLSGVKYELDGNENHFLIRTKEKILIEKIENGKFSLTRTNEVIKWLDMQ